MSLRVRFYELDPYGHVNHATYLQYFEAARVVWLDEMGHGLDRLLADDVQLVVTAVATKFISPALLNDQLTIETAMAEAGRVRAQWVQRALRGDDLIATQRINFATVNSANRPIRVPADLAAAMQQFQVAADWHVRDLPDLAL